MILFDDDTNVSKISEAQIDKTTKINKFTTGENGIDRTGSGFVGVGETSSANANAHKKAAQKPSAPYFTIRPVISPEMTILLWP